MDKSGYNLTIERLAERFAAQDVIILGNGPTGQRWQPEKDDLRPVWTIDDGFLRVPDAATATFVMDDLDGPAWKALRQREEWFATLRSTEIPVITTRHIPGFPTTVAYPLEDILRWGMVGYFADAVSYALAWAAFIGVSSLEMIGCDYWEIDRRQQRACAELWIGRCLAAGIPVHVHPYSKLLTTPPFDGLNRHVNGFYGYTQESFPQTLGNAIADTVGGTPRHSDMDAQEAAERAGY